MAIIVNLDVMLARRKMKVGELAEKVGITLANISILKNGKAKAVRMETLDKICAALSCQPGDILEYQPDFPGDSHEGEESGQDNRDNQDSQDSQNEGGN